MNAQLSMIAWFHRIRLSCKVEKEVNKVRKSICVLTLLICIVHLFALDNLASALNMNVQCYKAGPTPGYNCKNWSGRVTMTFVFYQPAT